MDRNSLSDGEEDTRLCDHQHTDGGGVFETDTSRLADLYDILYRCILQYVSNKIQNGFSTTWLRIYKTPEVFSDFIGEPFF